VIKPFGIGRALKVGETYFRSKGMGGGLGRGKVGARRRGWVDEGGRWVWGDSLALRGGVGAEKVKGKRGDPISRKRDIRIYEGENHAGINVPAPRELVRGQVYSKVRKGEGGGKAWKWRWGSKVGGADQRKKHPCVAKFFQWGGGGVTVRGDN